MTEQLINPTNLRGSGFFWQIYSESRDPILLIKDDYFLDGNPAALAQLGLHDKAELHRLTLLSISPPLQADGRASAEKLAEVLRKH